MLNPEKWIDNYSDALYVFALKRLGNNEVLAEDMVQDVFLSAWKNRETYNGDASEKTWLYTICKNKIIDYYRKQSRTIKVESETSKEEDDFFIADGHFNAAYKPVNDWNSSGSGKLAEKEFFSVLNNCKKKLKEIQEQVFSMKYLEDIEPTEICALLGISNKNYWVVMHRAKIKLRTCLEKNWIKL